MSNNSKKLALKIHLPTNNPLQSKGRKRRGGGGTWCSGLGVYNAAIPDLLQFDFEEAVVLLNGDSCCPEKKGLVFEIFLPLRKWVAMVEGYSYHGSGSQDKRKIADVDNEEKETR